MTKVIPKLANRSLSAFTNNFTYLGNNPSSSDIEQAVAKSTLPLFIEIDNLTSEIRHILEKISGKSGMSGQGVILATKYD